MWDSVSDVDGKLRDMVVVVERTGQRANEQRKSKHKQFPKMDDSLEISLSP